VRFPSDDDAMSDGLSSVGESSHARHGRPVYPWLILGRGGFKSAGLAKPAQECLSVAHQAHREVLFWQRIFVLAGYCLPDAHDATFKSAFVRTEGLQDCWYVDRRLGTRIGSYIALRIPYRVTIGCRGARRL